LAGGDERAVSTVRYQEIKNVLSEEVARGWTLALGRGGLGWRLLPELYIAKRFRPRPSAAQPFHSRKFEVRSPRRPRDFMTPKSCVLGHDSFKEWASILAM
jgi:hypothetical protein